MSDKAKNTAHTPTPWRVEGFDIVASVMDYPNTGIVTAVAARFCDMENGSVALDRDTIAANLEFIVKACNAYAEHERL